MLTRPVGRPPNHVLRSCASFSDQAGSWERKHRVVAKVEWHTGELCPRVGFIVTNLSRHAVRLQLHSLACNLANFMRTLALSKEVAHWSLTTLREKVVKIGA